MEKELTKLMKEGLWGLRVAKELRQQLNLMNDSHNLEDMSIEELRMLKSTSTKEDRKLIQKRITQLLLEGDDANG